MFNVCIKVCMVNSQPCPGVGKTALVVVAVQGASLLQQYHFALVSRALSSDCQYPTHGTQTSKSRLQTPFPDQCESLWGVFCEW
jgi:hypothetical protein